MALRKLTVVCGFPRVDITAVLPHVLSASVVDTVELIAAYRSQTHRVLQSYRCLHVYVIRRRRSMVGIRATHRRRTPFPYDASATVALSGLHPVVRD